MSLSLLKTALDLHAANGQLSDLRTFTRVIRTMDRRFGGLRTNDRPRQEEVRAALDAFQGAHVQRVLQKGRNVRTRFATLARWRPQLPPSERSEAGMAIFDSIRDHGLDDRHTLQARQRYARVLLDHEQLLLDHQDTLTNAYSRLGRIRRYYRDLQQYNRGNAYTYLHLIDQRVLRELGDLADLVRLDLLAAYTALDEVAHLCAEIRGSIETVKNIIQRFQVKKLNPAIQDNRSYQRLSSNRYEPTRRDEQQISRMA